jgi:hypothetical protein
MIAMEKGKRIVKIVLVAIVGLLVFGTVIMLLWNWLVPPIFKGPEIGYWQALGLFILAKIFFGGFGGGGWKRGGPHWRKRYYEKWSSMTPEERERFKQRMSEKWCGPARKKDEPAGQTNV